MSNHEQLLKEAVGHLKHWLPITMPYHNNGTMFKAQNNKWLDAINFLDSIDMRMDEANAKHQDVLREVSDQQCMMMAEENNKRFPLHPCSPAEFRVLINKLLCASLVLEGEL